jgi:hypothetical protein
MNDPIDAPTVPVKVNGRLCLLDRELSEADVRDLFENFRLRGNRDGLFAESSDQVIARP